MKFRAFLATSISFAMHVSGCADVEDGADQPGEAMVRQPVLTNCSSLPSMAQMSSIPTIDPEKELVLRDLKVVEDPCRTTWTATGCASGTLGAWTFGQLMATMSGDSNVNSTTARTFVNNWLRFWLTPQTNVNPDRPQTVQPRAFIGGALLFKWFQTTTPACSISPATGQADPDPAHWLAALQACPQLDLKTAPFRLLAIANRIDLDGRDYSGNGAPGELRFVYGLLNSANPALPTSNAEVILEYHFPNTMSPFSWAFNFHNLSGVPFTAVNPSFASRLQDITNLVVGPNAQPGNPNNGSSIAQIRTDENVFDPAASRRWEFRQFRLLCPSGPCQLSQVPVDQTPPTSDNNSASLTTWMTANKSSIATSHHVVPRTMLGASSLSEPLPNSTVWNTTGDQINGYTKVDPDRTTSFNVRHNFAFSTCNGCHYLETANTTQLLFHINPRAQGAKAPLSEFLNRTLTADPNDPGYPDPSNRLLVPDPNYELFDPFNTLYFEYNELWRRACEIRRIFVGFPTPMSSPTGHM